MKDFVVNHYGAQRMGLCNRCTEVNRKPSQTVPGMTLSLRQLVEKYVRGEDVTTFAPVYSEDVPAGVERLSRIEKIELSQSLQESIVSHRARLSVPPVPPVSPAPIVEDVVMKDAL